MNFLKNNLFSQLFLFYIILNASLFGETASTKCESYIELMEEYECLKKDSIGSGASGEVFLVSKDGETYIMKIQKNNQKAKRELKYLDALKPAPYVVTMFDYWIDASILITILEFGKKGTLLKLIQNHDPYFKDFDNSLIFFKKLFLGIQSIHQENIIHADLKLENIVVDENYDPLIIDFDLAVDKNEFMSVRGTKSYMAPEIIQSKALRNKIMYNEKVDLYSLGVIFYTMFKSKMPLRYSPFDYEDMISKEIQFDEDDPFIFYKIVKHLVTIPTKRFSDEELAEELDSIKLHQNYLKLGTPKSYSFRSLLFGDSSSQASEISQNSNFEKHFLRMRKSNVISEQHDDNFFKTHLKEIMFISVCVLSIGLIIFFIIFRRCKRDAQIQRSVLENNMNND